MRDHVEFEDRLNEVRRMVRNSLQQTSLREHVARFASSVGGGKLLRARLLLLVGAPAGVPRAVLCRTAAAVEMLHAASLVHDDVVDGGTRRRGEPALWVSEGARAAVLLGDLLVSLAAEGVQEALPSHLPLMVATLREMCDAQAEQEFAGAGADVSWDRCVEIARRKTGGLFGFAAACAGGSQPALVEALRRAGYALGTAYQLADDLLDVCPAPQVADKSLGTDSATGKLTAASAFPAAGVDPKSVIAALLQDSENELACWPKIQQAWREYVGEVVEPLVAQYTGATVLEAIA